MDTVTFEKLSSIKRRLQLLDAPHIEDADEQCMIELLLHPSDQRVHLLKWIITNYDSKFGTLLDESVPSYSSKVDSTHQKILLALSIMGVAKADDLELIRGSASQKKQIVFWDELIDIFYISQTGVPYLESSEVSQDSSYCLKPVVNDLIIHDLYKDSCNFLDCLVRKHKVKDIFSSELKLLPPDLENVIKEIKNSHVPTATTIKDIYESMCKDVEKLTKELEEETKHDIPDDFTVDNYCRKIDLTLKTFSQMIDNYSYCHGNDISTWCLKSKSPTLSDLGSRTATISDIYSTMQDLIKSISSYNNATTYLCERMKRDFEETTKVLESVGSTADRETCTIMQNSISRKRLSSK